MDQQGGRTRSCSNGNGAVIHGMSLQTIVLYCADDPLAVAAEFQTDSSCSAISASC
jgi:hypothetical protein